VTPATPSDWLVADELAPATRGTLAPLYEAAARQTLAMPFCAACQHVLELEQVICDACDSSTVEWHPVDRRGVVHAVTTVHRREPRLVLATEPYHVVDVELTSGHRVIMTTDRAVAAAPSIGDAVAVTFRTVGDVAVPAISTADTDPHEHDTKEPR
jgi:uncharacterized OB-fold protein